MNLTQVQHFLTIMKHMSLTKAAKELYITQPALSQSLSRLEKELGIPIEKTFSNYEQIKLMLENETLDLAITFPAIQGDKIITRIVEREEILVVLNGSHPLSRKETVTREDLLPYTFDILEQSNPYRKYINRLLQEKNISLRIRDHDYKDILELIRKNEYGSPFIMLSPKNLVGKWYGKGYQTRRIEGEELELVTGLSWRSNSDIPYKYRELISQIEEKYRLINESGENFYV